MFNFNDLKAIMHWSYLDTICRYRRSLLGPFWEVVNVFVLSIGISLIFGAVLVVVGLQMVFYVLCGVTFWQILSAFYRQSVNLC